MKVSLGWILSLCTLLVSSVNAQVITSPNDVKTKSSNASIKFETTSHSFGNIIEGQIARYDFKFVNTGTEPLILSNVSASCGCTTPKWPREAIEPGKSAIVTAEYNITRDGKGKITPVAFYKDALCKGSGTTLTVVFSGNNS